LNKKALARKYNTNPVLKETRQQLARWGRVNLLCNRSNEEMKSYQDRTKEVEALISHTDMRVSGGVLPDPTANAVEHLEKIRTSYHQLVTSCADDIESATEFKLAMDAVMKEMLTPDDILMFKLHYEDGYSWTMIAFKMSLSVDGLYKRERQAVEALSQRIRISQKSTV
jgi:DNA-directed RNA polymerase specialized sigma24 family protein